MALICPVFSLTLCSTLSWRSLGRIQKAPDCRAAPAARVISAISTSLGRQGSMARSRYRRIQVPGTAMRACCSSTSLWGRASALQAIIEPYTPLNKTLSRHQICPCMMEKAADFAKEGLQVCRHMPLTTRLLSPVCNHWSSERPLPLYYSKEQDITLVVACHQTKQHAQHHILHNGELAPQPSVHAGSGRIPRDEMEIATDVYLALQDFFERNEDLQHRPFILSGESYAGKYIPSIGEIISNCLLVVVC